VVIPKLVFTPFGRPEILKVTPSPIPAIVVVVSLSLPPVLPVPMVRLGGETEIE
jgi:hypothetical protein